MFASDELKLCWLVLYFTLLPGGDGGGGHWLVRMEWRPARLSVCLPLLIFPCTIKSRSSLLAPAHRGGPGKMAIKWLWCGGVVPGGVQSSAISVSVCL